MTKVATQWSPPDSGTASPDDAGGAILLENGGHILLENGGKLLLEDNVLNEKQPVAWVDSTDS